MSVQAYFLPVFVSRARECPADVMDDDARQRVEIAAEAERLVRLIKSTGAASRPACSFRLSENPASAR